MRQINIVLNHRKFPVGDCISMSAVESTYSELNSHGLRWFIYTLAASLLGYGKAHIVTETHILSDCQGC